MDAKYRVVAKGLAAKQNFSNEKKILKRKKKQVWTQIIEF